MKKTANISKTHSSLPVEYIRKLQKDVDGGYLASVHEFPGCFAYGESSEEALENLDSAAESWMLATQASGEQIPPPANFDDCSGKIALRISRGLHAQAAERALLEGVSLNQLISTAISSYIGKQDLGAEIKALLQAALNKNVHTVFITAYGNQPAWHTFQAAMDIDQNRYIVGEQNRLTPIAFTDIQNFRQLVS